jgi:hypothetical protein
VAEVAHRGTDRARVALDDDHAEAAGASLNGVRKADDAGADDDEVRGQSSAVVGHDADCTVIASVCRHLTHYLFKQVHPRLTCDYAMRRPDHSDIIRNLSNQVVLSSP